MMLVELFENVHAFAFRCVARVLFKDNAAVGERVLTMCVLAERPASAPRYEKPGAGKGRFE